MKRVILLSLLLLTLLSACDKKTEKVEGESFEAIHQRVLTEIESPEPPDWWPPDFLVKAGEAISRFIQGIFSPIGRLFRWIFSPVFRFFRWLLSLSLIFQITFYAFLALLLVYLFYKAKAIIIENRASGLKNIGSVKTKANHIARESDFFLFEALEQASRGNFSQAVITLHQGTVEYLHASSHLSLDRDYTNREIVLIIENLPQSQPFVTIAREAEIILFKGIEATKETFNRAESSYREGFLGGLK